MDLDNTDRAILYLLQEETRTSLSHGDIAERIGVSSSTVGNRIRQLKEEGILQDYQPKINYEEAGVPHHILFVCTAPIAERKEFAKRATEIDGVVNVRELLTGQRTSTSKSSASTPRVSKRSRRSWTISDSRSRCPKSFAKSTRSRSIISGPRW